MRNYQSFDITKYVLEDILIVIGRNKNFIEDHFDYSFELENTLAKHGKDELLEKVETIHGMTNIYYVRQNYPLGLGHAILKAKSFIGNDSFVIALGNDIIYNPEKEVTKQLIVCFATFLRMFKSLYKPQ